METIWPMQKNLNSHVATLLALLCIAAYALAGNHLDIPDYAKEYDPERDPISDISVARSAATESGKLLLLIVGGDWCSWCHTLDKEIKNNERFREVFEIIKVYIGPDNQNEELFSRLPEVMAYPHFYILNTRLELLGSQSLSPFEGNDQFSSRRRYNRNTMNKFLDQWADYLDNPANHPMQSGA